MVNREMKLPEARRDRLLCRELPSGIVLYDEVSHQAHSLNQAAALVWQQSDGRRTAVEMAALLHERLGLPRDEEIVWLAVDRLNQANLLHGQPTRRADHGKVTRRAVITRLGLAGGLVALLPLVDSVRSPAAAQAASPGNTHSQCVTQCTQSGDACRDACPPTGSERGACISACAATQAACIQACP